MEPIAEGISNVVPLASAAFGALKRAGFGESQESQKIQENFGKDSSGNDTSKMIHSIIILVALYLAFKCTKPGRGGVDVMQVVLAICCAPFYIVYRLAVPCN